MNKIDNTKDNKKCILMLNCHDDDVYCFRKEVIDELVSNNYLVVLSCPYGERLKAFERNSNIIIEDITIDRRGKNPVRDSKLLFDYIKIMKKYKPSVVLAFTIKPNIYGSMAARMLKIPYINNITGLGSGFGEESPLKKLVVQLYKVALKNTSRVFFQNEENMNLCIKEKMIEDRYELIPGSGVNTDRFSLLPYPTSKGTIVFNYIGRVLKDKGVDDYLEAAERIKSKYKDTEFNVIGFIEPTEMHYSAKLKELEDRGIIVYRGSQNDIRPYILHSHCTIHPSTYGEGMSNVLLESASSGRPVITTDIAGCREIVDDGATGYIYHAGDVDDLVSKIELFLSLDNEKRMKMGLNGRKKMCTNFSRNVVVNAYIREVEQLV